MRDDKELQQMQLLDRPLRNMEGDVGMMQTDVAVIKGQAFHIMNQTVDINKKLDQMTQIKIPTEVTIHIEANGIEMAIGSAAIVLVVGYLIGRVASLFF